MSAFALCDGSHGYVKNNFYTWAREWARLLRPGGVEGKMGKTISTLNTKKDQFHIVGSIMTLHYSIDM